MSRLTQAIDAVLEPLKGGIRVADSLIEELEAALGEHKLFEDIQLGEAGSESTETTEVTPEAPEASQPSTEVSPTEVVESLGEVQAQIEEATTPVSE